MKTGQYYGIKHRVTQRSGGAHRPVLHSRKPRLQRGTAKQPRERKAEPGTYPTRCRGEAEGWPHRTAPFERTRPCRGAAPGRWCRFGASHGSGPSEPPPRGKRLGPTRQFAARKFVPGIHVQSERERVTFYVDIFMCPSGRLVTVYLVCI